MRDIATQQKRKRDNGREVLVGPPGLLFGLSLLLLGLGGCVAGASQFF